MKTINKNKEGKSATLSLTYASILSLLISLFMILSVQGTLAAKAGKVAIVGLTEAGHNVVIELTDMSAEKNPVTVIFDEIQRAGITKMKKTDMSTLPSPSRFKLRTEPLYYSMVTTAEYRNDVKICIDYKGKDILKEGALRMLHLENGSWVELKTDLDYRNDIICGTTTSLSDFVLVEDPRYVYGPTFWAHQARQFHR